MRSLRKKKPADSMHLNTAWEIAFMPIPQETKMVALHISLSCRKLKEKHGLTKANIKRLAIKRVIYMLIFSNKYYGCINPKIDPEDIKYYL